jgi:integrase
MRRDLSDAFLRALKPPAAGRLELRDTKVKGLVLRVSPAGVATWSVRTRTAEGKQTRPALGTWPALGISDARKAALSLLAAVHRGADPVAEKREKRAAREAREREPTVAERVAEWQAARAADPARPWSHRHAAEVARVVKADILPALGKRPLRETTRADWVGLVERKRKAGAPAMASLLFRIVSAFLGHAEAAGWIPSPLLPRKGARLIAPPPAARARVLSDAELRLVWKASEAEAPKVRAFLRLLILTAAREGEVAGIVAGEVDRAAGLWRLPATRTKNRAPITLPLSRLALGELAAVWPNEAPKAGYHLLGRFAKKPLSGFSRIKRRLDDRVAALAKAEGMDPPAPWRLHDLRRTARTGMTQLGIPPDHAEAALNHVSGRSALVRTYDRHDYGPEILAALSRWQAHVAGLVGEGAEVVPLEARRRWRAKA